MKKTKRLRLISLFLVLLLCLCACGSDAQAEAEVKDALEKNYQSALNLYCAVYGAGLPVSDGYAVDPDGNAYSQYAPLASDVPYQSSAQLKEAIEAYFSESMAAQMCAIAFGSLYGDGTSDGSNATGTPMGARYTDLDGKLQINMVHTARFAESEAMIPDFATVRFRKAAKARAVFSVTLHPADQSRTYQTEWTMLKEDGVWKFDTPPYVSICAVEEL